MKKVLLTLSVFASVLFVSCEKNEVAKIESEESITMFVNNNTVTLINNSVGLEADLLIEEFTVPFEYDENKTEEIILNIDSEGSLHHVIMSKDVYEKISAKFSNEHIISGLTPMNYFSKSNTKMTGNQYLQKMSDCGDSNTELGTIGCWAATTARMYKDCIQSEGAAESTHCW